MSKLLILVILLFSAPAFSYQESEGIDNDIYSHYEVNVSDFALPSETIEVNACWTVTGENTRHRLTNLNSKPVKFAALNRTALPFEVGWRS